LLIHKLNAYEGILILGKIGYKFSIVVALNCLLSKYFEIPKTINNEVVSSFYESRNKFNDKND